jgi:tRNA-dihydrouridine synthase A
MVGREAYHNPWLMSDWDATFYGQPASDHTREFVEQQMVDYMAREAALHGTPWSTIARHMLGLRHGLQGARRWRQVWSDHRLKGLHPAEVAVMARGETVLNAI